MDFKNKIDHELDHVGDCGCENNNNVENRHNHTYSHEDEETCDCNHDEHSHDHDDHQGCACEHGLLEDIENVEEKKSKKPLAILVIGANIFLFGYCISTLSFNITSTIDQHIISQLIYLIVVLVVGRGIITHGVKSLLNKEVKIELLITLATVGAFLLGDGGEGATLMLLFFLAEYLEHYSLDRSKSSLSKLVKLSPDVAIVKRNVKDNKTNEYKLEEVEINVKNLSIDDIVIVKPGDKIPIDGIIVKGITSIDQSSITGESLATTKSEGDEVYASTINEDGYIEIRVTKKSNDTIFSKIINLIKESEEKKAKIDLFVDKFAKYYTPSIIVLAIFVAIIPPLLLNQPFDEWIYRALVLLVISCPCPIAISTPVSIVSAITAGTKNGIIIKGGEYVEELSKITAIMFDKTGTLTEGNLEIANISPINNFNEEEIIKIACSLEKNSKHPIAKAFNEYRNNKQIGLLKVDNFQSISGKGLKGEINGEIYYLGKKELFNYNKALEKDIEDYNKTTIDDAKGLVLIGNQNEIIGFIGLIDKIREETPATISKLKEKSIETIMLTGDQKSTAQKVADKIGIDSYHSNLLPEDKVNILEKISSEYKYVGMVGDGVNDTPSLARANVGIVMGMDGADVAVETADIVLMQDNLSKIDYLINLSKKTMGIIKQNITIPLTVKAILTVLGIIGYVSLWEAVLIGDMGLTLLVVVNALRIGNKN
ncbi:Copper-exporting P-type ATPase B [Candidatus Methanobinarius endosymbioticus]|uniref:Copper-exporting P-type ATPase B n=1 Tax=Candidatus Methanobinarius endosymbioticus TaxID=2006182 RepID=A0A366MAW3_9EURY|nr:Copper-exporting P-type ATPase B [Candidatus Methanobinarius endosymbioticus]